MRINFDELPSIENDSGLTYASTQPIRVELQSALDQQVSAVINPYNYRNEIKEFDSLDMMPSISLFLTKQIQKEISSGRESKADDTLKPHLQTCPSLDGYQSSKSGIDMPVFSRKKQSKQHILQYELNRKINKPAPKKKASNKLEWVYKYKKHSCTQNVPSRAMRETEQFHQAPHQPYLKPNKYNRKICQGRKLNSYVTATSHRYNVYQKLYQQAHEREIRRNLHHQMHSKQFERSKPKINQTYLKQHMKQYIPLEKRTQAILEQRLNKIKQKIGTDCKTGKKLFQPDLSVSKESYRRLAHAVTETKIVIPVKKIQALNETVKVRKNNRKKQQSLDSTTIQFYTSCFYPQNSIAATQPARDTQSPLHALKKQQFQVLKPFLQEVEEMETKGYELETNLSSANSKSMNLKDPQVMGKQVFREKLTKYYQGITLHDREILRKEIRKLRRAQAKGCKEQNIQRDPTFRPSINIRSASLDSILNRHDQQLYYI